MKKYIIAFALILLFIIVVTSIMTSVKIETYTNIGGLENPTAAPQTPNDLTAYTWLRRIKPGFIESLENEQAKSLIYIVFSLRPLTTNLLGSSDMNNVTFRDSIVIPKEVYKIYDIDNTDARTIEIQADASYAPPNISSIRDIFTFEKTDPTESPEGYKINAANLSNTRFKTLLEILESRLNKEYYITKRQLEDRKVKLLSEKATAEQDKTRALSALSTAKTNYDNAVNTAQNMLKEAKEPPFTGNTDVNHNTTPPSSLFADHMNNTLADYNRRISIFEADNIETRCKDVWQNTPGCNATYGCNNFSTA